MKRDPSRRRCSWRPFITGLLLLIPACSDQDDTVQPSNPDLEVNGELHAGSTTVLPNTPVGRQLAWVIEAVNGEVSRLGHGELDAHFDPNFLRVRGHDQVLEQLASTARDDAPLTFREVSPDTSPESALALVDGARTQLTIGMNVGADHGKITGLEFRPLVPPPEPEPLDSWQAVTAALQGITPGAQLLVAEVTGETCQPLHEHAAEQALALSSTASLYVVAELARQVEAGTLAWSSPVTVQSQLKSLPPGELETLPAGTELELWAVADKMLAQSDNSAADHLITLLGRENVEGVLPAAGHAAPQLNVPFLTTRELFLFRLELSEPELDAYLDMAVPQRRAFLAGLSERMPLLESARDWFMPRRIQELEWFASAQDLCRLMAHLRTRSEAPGMGRLADVLSQDPGLPLDPAEFPFVSFKGGSEPGVLNLTWLVERADGKRLFVTIGLNNPASPILNVAGVFRAASAIFELLRNHP